MGNVLVRTICTATFALLPFLGGILFYKYFPGFIIPFLNNSVARTILMALIFWECIGLYLLFGAKDWKSWWLFAMIFGQPLLITLAIGPYILTGINVVAPFLDLTPSACGTNPPARAGELGNLMLAVVARYRENAPIALHSISTAFFVVGIMLTYPGIWLRLFGLTRKANNSA
jgi:hypothetical protein